jgi:hypothetical protein
MSSTKLQMAKFGKDTFHVDFEYPLSPMAAFGIAIARFDTIAE